LSRLTRSVIYIALTNYFIAYILRLNGKIDRAFQSFSGKLFINQPSISSPVKAASVFSFDEYEGTQSLLSGLLD